MPISISPDFVVNSTTANNQYTPVITALADGRFVVTWFSNEGTNNDIRARVYGADGTAAGADFIINSTTANDQSSPVITALADGRFVVTWSSNEGTNYDIRARLYGVDGIAEGLDLVVNSTTLDEQYFPSITGLADGRFVVAWQSYEGIATSSEIRARIFGVDGAAAGNDFVINTTTVSHQYNPSIVALADGRFVVAWQSYEGIATSSEIRARIYGTDGSAVGADFVINSTTADSQENPDITALADGRFVVTWSSDEGAATGNDIRARIYGADGTAAGNDFVINTTTDGEQYRPSIVALADGRFVVAWLSNETATADIRARVYGADGTAAGPDFLTNSTIPDGQYDPSITVLADGRLVVTWYSFEGATGNDIRASILDPNNFQGTPGNNEWTGGSGVDKLFGYAGDDTLSGGGSDDYLNGGGGGDTLRGGGGNDRLEGGLSNDFLFGGADNDTLWGGQGIDTMKGGKGLDKFLYMNRNEAGDTITKFEAGDKFVFEGQAFKLGTFVGKLNAANFKTGTTNKAGDANDYFIYRTTDDTLWFDADGKGGAGPIKIAGLSNNFDLHASDILII
jgi:Ca2+-binding RTX toxin-like protein